MQSMRDGSGVADASREIKSPLLASMNHRAEHYELQSQKGVAGFGRDVL